MLARSNPVAVARIGIGIGTTATAGVVVVSVVVVEDEEVGDVVEEEGIDCCCGSEDSFSLEFFSELSFSASRCCRLRIELEVVLEVAALVVGLLSGPGPGPGPGAAAVETKRRLRLGRLWVEVSVIEAVVLVAVAAVL